MRRQLLILPLLFMFGSGCDRSTPSNDKSATTSTKPAAPSDGADLRSLPYAGGVSIEEDEKEGVVVYDEKRSYPGLNLFSVQKLCTAILMDEHGNVLRKWSHQPGQSWSNVELLPNGDIIVPGADLPDKGAGGLADEKRYLLRMNWAGEVVWKLNIEAHHDAELTPSGDILTLTFERRQIPALHPRIPTRDDQLTLLSQEGKTLETISLYDVLSAKPDLFPWVEVKPTKSLDGQWIDLFHCNSVEWMRQKHLVGNHPVYDLDNVLVCSRHQNRVFVVNWKRKELVWAWGKDQLDGPHNATMLANGNILVFDNGLYRKWSRVIQIDPTTGEVVWEYKAKKQKDFYTPSKGANQRFPNGNTLISNSDNGQVIEVDPKGEIVWKYVNPLRSGQQERATIVRMKRYDRAFIEAIEKSASSAPASQPQ